MRWRALILAACVCIAGCAREPSEPAIFGSDVDAITSAEHQLNEAAAARDVDAAMALYHSNAAMISPNGDWLIPRDIRRYYEAMADDPSARLELERASVVEVAASEGLAYSSGTYMEMHASTELGQVRVTTGQTVRVWKREDGAWRIALETRTPRDVRDR